MCCLIGAGLGAGGQGALSEPAYLARPAQASLSHVSHPRVLSSYQMPVLGVPLQPGSQRTECISGLSLHDMLPQTCGLRQ